MNIHQAYRAGVILCGVNWWLCNVTSVGWLLLEGDFGRATNAPQEKFLFRLHGVFVDMIFRVVAG